MSIKTRLFLFVAAVVLIPEPTLSAGFTKFLLDFDAPLIGLVAGIWAIDSARELMYVGLFSWWCYGTAIRLAWTYPARAFGFDAPDWGRFYRLLLPPWRWPYRLIMAPFRWLYRQLRRSTHAAAGWEAKLGILARYGNYTPGKGIPFGRFVWGIPWFETLAYRGKLGVNLVGKPGTGKTATIMTWLGSIASDASAFFIDVDGEITRVIGGWLERSGHQLHVIDLLNGHSGHRPGSYNVFAEFEDIERREGREAVVPAMKAAGDALVVQENKLQETFDNGARDFVVAVMAFVYLWPDIKPKERNLATVRKLIAQGVPPQSDKETSLDALLFEMREMMHGDDGCAGMMNNLIANGASAMESGTNAAGGNPFLGSAKRATSAWDLPAVIAATSARDFTMAELKTGNAVVSVVCAVGDMRTTYQPLVRLMVKMLEYRFTKMPRCRRTPAAVVIDEAQNLGELSICMTGPYMRKHEMQLVLGVQDYPGMEAVYGVHRAQSIFSNAGLNCYFPTTDVRTIQGLVQVLGIQTVREKIEGTPWYLRLILPRRYHVTNRFANVERPLKNFEQARDTLSPEHGRMIVLCEGRPFIAAVNEYWKALPVWRYAPSTYSETPGRRLTRLAVKAARRAAETFEQRAQVAFPALGGVLDRAFGWPSGASAGAAPVALVAGTFAALCLADVQKRSEGWPVSAVVGAGCALVVLLCVATAVFAPLWAAASRLKAFREGPEPVTPHAYGRDVGVAVAVMTGGALLAQAFQLLGVHAIVRTMAMAGTNPLDASPVFTVASASVSQFQGGEWFIAGGYGLLTLAEAAAVLVVVAAGLGAALYGAAAVGMLGGAALYWARFGYGRRAAMRARALSVPAADASEDIAAILRG